MVKLVSAPSFAALAARASKLGPRELWQPSNVASANPPNKQKSAWLARVVELGLIR